MEHYTVTLTGTMPLLMHADNIAWADSMDAWRKDPENKSQSVPGDDRTPAWRWIGSLYHDGHVVAMPSDTLMRCFMEGGAMLPVGTGKKTFKAQTQSGSALRDLYWPLAVNDSPIPMTKILPLMDERDFSIHEAWTQKLGFELFTKRARVGQAKHIRVRPRFNAWRVTGVLHVWDAQLTLVNLQQIWTYAGAYKGLGDWRPGSKTPGPHGTFKAEVSVLKA